MFCFVITVKQKASVFDKLMRDILSVCSKTLKKTQTIGSYTYIIFIFHLKYVRKINIFQSKDFGLVSFVCSFFIVTNQSIAETYLYIGIVGNSNWTIWFKSAGHGHRLNSKLNISLHSLKRLNILFIDYHCFENTSSTSHHSSFERLPTTRS